jgi:hypothetical protein
MSKAVIANAGNTLAPALSVLQSLGFVVSRSPSNTSLLQAENGEFCLLAEDPLQLLGLASLALHRGISWQPTDAEIDELLRIDSHSGT